MIWEFFIATSQYKETGPYDLRERRENNRSNRKHADQENGTETDNGNGQPNTYECCGKVFISLHGLRIHQGKVCKKKGTQQRRCQNHESCDLSLQDDNHSGTNVTVESEEREWSEKKPKVKWPKSNEKNSYEEFDIEVNKMVSKFQGSAEEKLEMLAETIYQQGKDKFGLEREGGARKTIIHNTLSRREMKIRSIKKEKKALRARWLKADEDQKAGLLKLYQDIKARLREEIRKDRRLQRRKKREQCRKSFLKEPFKFAKTLFSEARSGKLECSKEELENHLKSVYGDENRMKERPPIEGLRRPSPPGIPFDVGDIKKSEFDAFIKKARAKSSPGNDGVSYKAYKYCPRLRLQLFFLVREMWMKKDVAKRWCIAEGIYLPKQENAQGIGQFRPVSLLNIDGKIIFGIVANRIIDFVQKNGFVNESVQKAGIPGIPGCIEHAYGIWDDLQEAKKKKESVAVVWLDLANAYGSVPHDMIKKGMEFFWIPEPIQQFVMKYYSLFKMRFTTTEFTTTWQRLEVGIAAGCTISVILFVLVMELLLRASNTNSASIPKLRAFMDDIAVKTTEQKLMREVLRRLDELINWSDMKFKAKKSRSITLIKGKQSEVRYVIGGENIPTVKEEPVKSLGRWYKAGLRDSEQGKVLKATVEKGLKAIDKTELPGKYKCWCLQFGLYPRVRWTLQMYEIPLTTVERVEQRCGVFIRKWLGLPKQLNNTALYGKMSQLQLPISSVVEEYKATKVQTVMMLRFSNDSEIKENPPLVKTGRKWKAEEATCQAISNLNHADIIGAVQEAREGVGLLNFRPFCEAGRKQKRQAVVAEVRREEQEKRYLHLVQCPQQGQCVRWEENVVGRKIGWKEIWSWERSRTSFLIKSTYDVMPSPANLLRWKVAEDDRCRCGKKGTLRHILSNCHLSLDRYTWRHNEILKIIHDVLKRKLDQFNDGALPKEEKITRMRFCKAGKAAEFKSHKRVPITDERWQGSWKMATDLESKLVFPVTVTEQRPDAVLWCDEKKICMILELTVPWEENIKQAEERKAERYSGLIEECEEKGWSVEYHHMAVGTRGYIDKKLVNLFRKRFCCTNIEVRRAVKDLQETAERSSHWIWLKREDSNWLEN